MNRKSILRSILPIALVAMAAPVFADEVSENLIINGQVLPGCQLQISPLDNLDINSLSLSQVASSPTGIGARCNTGTAYEIACRDFNDAAGRAGINGLLHCRGAECLSVTDGAKVRDTETLRQRRCMQYDGCAVSRFVPVG